ncbi:MAG: ATP synthase F1 subunit epsilon [Candidatus Saccharibacteria bacterium]|nr:ATP synthase F1 subunit epsilon [Candidatus Saccharibacteria bacterium]
MIHFELVTLDGVKFSQEVYEVQLPTTEGYVGIFKDHMPLVTLADTGIIKIRHKSNESDAQQELIATSGGVVDVEDNTVRVLVDAADTEDEIDEASIKKAHQEALELRKNAKDQLSLDKAHTLVQRTHTQLKVAELKHRKRRG